jgi:hypothetical protein
MQSMRILLFTVLGILLGLALGVAAPIGLSLFFAWLDDFKPGAGAGTAFALLLPFTALAGACFGGSLCYLRGKYGSWSFNDPKASTNSLFEQFSIPSPLNDRVIQELAFPSSNADDFHDKREALLEVAEQQYEAFKLYPRHLVVVVLLCIFVPFLGLPLAIGYAGKRYLLRSQIESARTAWSHYES